jgi:outer membrane protein, heavy metal efflux system
VSRLFVFLPLCTLLACAAPTRSREWLGRSVQERTSLNLGSGAADAGLAPGVVLEDGLTATEAAALSLWNNPALHAELSQLEASLASLDEAKRPANPRINNLLAPLDPRQLAIVLFVPIESLWQMPSRIEAATAELEASADTLLQLVLDTERTVRSAHADVLLAVRRIVVLQRTADAWGQSVELADARASSGDIAPAEADALRAEWLLASDAVQRAQHEVNIARARLMTLLGATTLPELAGSPLPLGPKEDLASLQALALKQRPELSAAALSVNAAAARASWERSRVFSIFLSIDGQAPVGGFAPQFAPGLQAELPIFSQNQGSIGRADAQVVRATHRYAATRLTVLQEVATSQAALLRATASLEAAHRIAALLENAREASARAFQNGDQSYVVVVDALRRTTDAQLRELEIEAELRRAEAEFLRAIGGRTLVEKP